MRDDVVARAFEARVDAVVEGGLRGFAEVALFQRVDERRRGALDEEQRRGLERLDEALRQAHGHAVAAPVLRVAADTHLQVPRRHVRVEQAQVRAQLGLGGIGGAVRAAVDVAVAIARGQRDLPRPAVAHRRGHGLRLDGAVAQRRGHGDRRVVEQVLRERHVGRLQRLADQQRGEAGAVDEEVGVERVAALELERRDVAALVQLGRVHVARHVHDAALQRLLVQEGPEQAGIEVVAVADVEREMARRLRCLAAHGEPLRQEEAIGMRMHVGIVQARVDVAQELRHRQVVQRRRERMEVALEARTRRPAIERDAALVGRVAGRHPLGLRDAQALEERAQPGCRALAHADDADHRRLQHRHLQSLAELRVGQQQRRHPARGAAADDGDVPDRRLGQPGRAWRRWCGPRVGERGGVLHGLHRRGWALANHKRRGGDGSRPATAKKKRWPQSHRSSLAPDDSGERAGLAISTCSAPSGSTGGRCRSTRAAGSTRRSTSGAGRSGCGLRA